MKRGSTLVGGAMSVVTNSEIVRDSGLYRSGENPSRYIRGWLWSRNPGANVGAEPSLIAPHGPSVGIPQVGDEGLDRISND
ncbi:MAG: hypothetical protein NZ807_03385 [Dehalococcoidia bacterium]|nr:hypothetical protein [Dehalococcoidia bacterium]